MYRMGIGTKSKVPWKLRRYILLSVDDDNFTLVSFLVSGSCAKTLAMQQGDRIFIQNGGVGKVDERYIVCHPMELLHGAQQQGCNVTVEPGAGFKDITAFKAQAQRDARDEVTSIGSGTAYCNLVVNIMADAPPPPCTASASDENQIVFNTQTVNGSGLTFYARDDQGLPGPGDLVLIVCGDCRSSDGQRVNLGENTTFWVLLKGTPEQGRHPIFNDSAALSSSSSAAASSIERSPSDASKTIIVTAIKPGGDGQQVFSLAKPPTKNACAVQVDVLVPGWKVESFALNLQGRSSPLVLTSVNDPHDKIWWTIPDGASIIANMISMPAPVQVHDLSNLIICIEEVPHVLGDLYATMGATTSKHDVRLAFAPHFVPELQLDEELILTIQGEPGTVHWVTSELLDACATHWMGVNLSRVQAPPSAPKPSQDKNPGNGKKPKTK